VLVGGIIDVIYGQKVRAIQNVSPTHPSVRDIGTPRSKCCDGKFISLRQGVTTVFSSFVRFTGSLDKHRTSYKVQRLGVGSPPLSLCVPYIFPIDLAVVVRAEMSGAWETPGGMPPHHTHRCRPPACLDCVVNLHDGVGRSGRQGGLQLTPSEILPDRTRN